MIARASVMSVTIWRRVSFALAGRREPPPASNELPRSSLNPGVSLNADLCAEPAIDRTVTITAAAVMIIPDLIEFPPIQLVQKPSFPQKRQRMPFKIWAY